MFGYIYKTTNILNNRVYVGKKHSSKFDPNYYGSGKLLIQAIEKYGIENFKIEILHWSETLADLNLNEIRLIEEYSMSHDCYNIAKGGTGGDTTTNNPDRIELIERRKEGIQRWYNCITPDERELISMKISAAKKGRSNGRTGYHHDEETKRKIADAQRGRKMSEERLIIHNAAMKLRIGHRPGNSIRIEIDGVVYETLKDACEKLKTYKKKLYKMVKEGRARYVE